MIRFYIKMFFYAQFEKLRKKVHLKYDLIKILHYLRTNHSILGTLAVIFILFLAVASWLLESVISPVYNTALWGMHIFHWGIQNKSFRVRQTQSWFLTYIIYYLHKLGQDHHFSASDHIDLKRKNCLRLSFILYYSLHFLTQSNYSIHHYLRSPRTVWVLLEFKP